MNEQDHNYERRMQLAGEVGRLRAWLGNAQEALRNGDSKQALWCLEQARETEVMS